MMLLALELPRRARGSHSNFIGVTTCNYAPVDFQLQRPNEARLSEIAHTQ